MDVFTILVFFLLVNSGSTELLEAPKQMILPESIVETKPRETVFIYVNKDEVVVQGQAVVRVTDILVDDGHDIEPIMARLAQLQDRVIGVSTQTVAASDEVTILLRRGAGRGKVASQRSNRIRSFIHVCGRGNDRRENAGPLRG
jgi:hypothetical protein